MSVANKEKEDKGFEGERERGVQTGQREKRTKSEGESDLGEGGRGRNFGDKRDRGVQI